MSAVLTTNHLPIDIFDIPVSVLGEDCSDKFRVQSINAAWVNHPILRKLWRRSGEVVTPNDPMTEVVVEDCRCVLSESSTVVMTVSSDEDSPRASATLMLQSYEEPESSKRLIVATLQGDMQPDFANAGHQIVGCNTSGYALQEAAAEGMNAFSERRSSLSPTLAARPQDTDALLELGNDGIWEWNVWTGALWFNDHWRFKLGHGDAVAVSSIEQWLALVHPQDRDSFALALSTHVADETKPIEDEHRIRLRDESWRWVQVRGKLVERDWRGGPLRVIGTITDIHRRKHSENAVRHIATHDALTGLANRYMFQQELNKATARAQRIDRGYSLLLLDLDNFKQINDSMGHFAGDQLLKEAALRLRSRSKAGELIARLGGDEFALIVPHIQSDDDGCALASRLANLFMEPFTIEGIKQHVGVTIGVSVFPTDARDPNDLLANADLALYAAKADGRGSWRRFDEHMQVQALERNRMERELRGALDTGELELHYQPIVSLSGLQVQGIEALLRWRHPSRGLLAPDQFLHLADNGQIVFKLNRFVLESALAQQRQWRDIQAKMPPIHVNMNPRLFASDDWTSEVMRIIDQSKIGPGTLVIELVENDASSDKISHNLKRLRRKGVKIGIDDFGIGHSSLGRLRTMPIDVLKIDRCFLTSNGKNSSDSAIIKAILALAKEMKIPSIAEGIETREAMHWLQQLGCEGGQGYLIARPMLAESFGAWFEAWRDTHAIDGPTDLLKETSTRPGVISA